MITITHKTATLTVKPENAEQTRELLARIDALQRALGAATATLEAIADGGLNGSMNAHQCAYAAAEGL